MIPLLMGSAAPALMCPLDCEAVAWLCFGLGFAAATLGWIVLHHVFKR